MPWQAKIDGASLEVEFGVQSDADGRESPIRKVVVARAGQPLSGELAPHLVKRWEEGEEHIRSLVDRLDEDGNIVSTEAFSVDESKLSDEERDYISEAKAAVERAQAEADEARSETESSTTALQESNDKVSELEARVSELEAEAAVPQVFNWDHLSPEALSAEANKRGLTVTGTGKDGNVIKADNVAALTEDDAKS